MPSTPIVAALLEEYAVDEATLRVDIERLLDELVAAQADRGLTACGHWRA